jgi:hypothetical protein
MTRCDNETLREQILQKLIEISHSVCAEFKVSNLPPEVDKLFDDAYDLVDNAFETEDA